MVSWRHETGKTLTISTGEARFRIGTQIILMQDEVGSRYREHQALDRTALLDQVIGEIVAQRCLAQFEIRSIFNRRLGSGGINTLVPGLGERHPSGIDFARALDDAIEKMQLSTLFGGLGRTIEIKIVIVQVQDLAALFHIQGEREAETFVEQIARQTDRKS